MTSETTTTTVGQSPWFAIVNLLSLAYLTAEAMNRQMGNMMNDGWISQWWTGRDPHTQYEGKLTDEREKLTFSELSASVSPDTNI